MAAHAMVMLYAKLRITYVFHSTNRYIRLRPGDVILLWFMIIAAWAVGLLVVVMWQFGFIELELTGWVVLGSSVFLGPPLATMAVCESARYLYLKEKQKSAM